MKSASFRDVLGQRDFSLLWYGQIISSIGDRFYLFALLSVVIGIKQGMDVGQDTARFLFCAMLPGVLLAPLYGWLVDHFSRKWVMIWSDLIRVLLTLSLLEAWLSTHNLFLVYTLVFFMGALNGLFIPARQAALPQIVPVQSLITANALISLIGVIANLVGVLLAGLIVSIFGASSSFLLNAFGFLCSAWCVYHIRADLTPEQQEKTHGPWHMLLGGWHVLLEQAELRPLVLVATTFSFIGSLGIITILQQIVVTMDLSTVAFFVDGLKHLLNAVAPKPPVFDLKPLAFGLIFAAIGLGVGAGIGFCGWAQRWSRSKGLPYLALCFLGLALIGFGQLHFFLPALLGAGVLGFVTALILIPIEARLQNDVDDARRGRLFALKNFCTTAGFLLGLMVNIDGRLLRTLGPNAYMDYIGLGTVALASGLAILNGSILKTFWKARTLP